MCRLDQGYVRDFNGDCVCPPGQAVDNRENCAPCRTELGFRVDETGHCVCALERGLVIDERGRCVCPVEHGYVLTAQGDCIQQPKNSGCVVDEDCAQNRFCDLSNGRCEDPCLTKICGISALCNATQHQAVCQCLTGYTGDAEVQCSKCDYGVKKSMHMRTI